MEDVIKNPTIPQLNSLVTGTESAMRNRLETYIDIFSVLGREYYRFSSSDPRWSDVILGKDDANFLAAGGFYASIPWMSAITLSKTVTCYWKG